MRHHVAIFLVVSGICGTLYAAWALHRASDAVLVQDMSWPRPAPYPDTWIAALDHWYDVRNPAPVNTLKLHGELPHVRVIIGLVLVSGLWVLVVGLRMRLVQRPHGPEGKA